MRKLRHLFSSIAIKGMEVKNRIVMPPMYMKLGGNEGSITQNLSDYYEARARGGVGLIIVEPAEPNATRKHLPRSLGLFDDSLIPGWRDLAKKVHAHGAKIATQLMDPGPVAPSSLSGIPPVGPSPVADRGHRELPRELSLEEITAVIAEFAEAARRAKEAGLDAVEIHAAHGYAMVGSFLSSYYNKRTDIYGGSLEARLKFLLDIIEAIRSKVEDDFPIIVRISGDERLPGGRTFRETQFIAPMIVQAGADALEISGGSGPLSWTVVPPAGTPLALNAGYAEAVKQVVDVPVICVGRINSPQIAEFILETGKADMVSMGRALIADPELPKKSQAGCFEDIVPCIGDNQGCLVNPFSDRPATCTMNPSMGREKENQMVPVTKPKRVMVVGGGPAGLEAARVTALRGHQVTLFEKEKKLGGQINIASVPPFKQEISKVIKFLSRQVEKAGVEVKVGQEVDPELVEKWKPQAVVVASGACPRIPDDIPGIHSNRVVTAWDVLAGRAGGRAKRVVVVGGDSLGCETADFLAETGDDMAVGQTTVTIVEMRPKIALGMPFQTRHLLMERLRNKDVCVITSALVKEILEDGVLFVKDGREEMLQNIDVIILAVGSQPADTLSEKIKDKVDETYVIGDARKPRSVLEAIAEGRDIGLKI